MRNPLAASRSGYGRGEGADLGLLALLLLGLQDVRRALVTCEQVCAVFGIEERAQRFDAARNQDKIILAKREDRVDQVMALTFIAEVLFQAVGEEGKQVCSVVFP